MNHTGKAAAVIFLLTRLAMGQNEYMGTVRPSLAGKSGDPPSYRDSSTRRAAMFRH